MRRDRGPDLEGPVDRTRPPRATHALIAGPRNADSVGLISSLVATAPAPVGCNVAPRRQENRGQSAISKLRMCWAVGDKVEARAILDPPRAPEVESSLVGADSVSLN